MRTRDGFGRYEAAVIDENWLRKRYVDNKKSVQEIAKELNIAKSAIYHKLRKVGLMAPLLHKEPLVLDEEVIKDMYFQQHMSLEKIAPHFGVCRETIGKVVKKFGDIRSPYDDCYAGHNCRPLSTEDTELMVKKYLEEGKSGDAVGKEMHIDAKSRLRKLGLIKPTTDKAKVRSLYESGMSMGQVGKEMGIAHSRVSVIMKHLGAKTRSRTEALFNRKHGKVIYIDEDKVKTMYVDSKMSLTEIAKGLGVSPMFIYRIIIKLGVIRSKADASRLMWQKPEYLQKVHDGFNKKPNIQESHVDAIIQEHFPGEFEYNGDYKLGVSIGGRIPDWVHINGRRKLIEYNGCFPHCCPQCGFKGFKSRTPEWVHKKDKRKLKTYKKHGFETLVLWGHDSDDDVKNKVGEFIKQRSLNLTGASSTNVK